MKILAIETSCDETAIALLACAGDEHAAEFEILGNSLISQIDVHQQYGGVFPALAKREHAKNLVPLLLATLEEAHLSTEATQTISESVREEISVLLSREPGLTELFFAALADMKKPSIDAIAVTVGPGLEPALWVGVNFAKALSIFWDVPLIAVNHMEGHLLAALAEETEPNSKFLEISDTKLPLLGLLISGGHTELVCMDTWLSYSLIGATRDDAVGEAYDKVARMLGLPYPGGPEISRLADIARTYPGDNPYTLPRPMIRDPHCDFSFSGLKTAALYLIQDLKKNNGNTSQEETILTALQKEYISLAFEEACADVLVSKTMKALEQTSAHTLAIGGGVSANSNIKKAFTQALEKEGSKISLAIPTPKLSGDNAVMIALAGYYRALRGEFADPQSMLADGNLSLAKK